MIKYLQLTIKNKKQYNEDLCPGQPLFSNLAIFIFALDFKILNITDTSEVPSFLPQSLYSLLSSGLLDPEFSVYQPLTCLLLLKQTDV